MTESTVGDAKPNGLRCQFQVMRDKSPATGILLMKKKMYDCGENAGSYRCEGELSSLEMNLCDKHRDFVISRYGWKVVKIEDRVEISTEGAIEIK